MSGLARAKERALKLFSSIKLAVFLLIILAAVSVFGTFIPQAQEPLVYIRRYGEEHYRYLRFFGIIDLYHSWGFRTIAGLLAINLSVCSYRRFRWLYKSTIAPVTEKTGETIRRLRLSNELPAAGHVEMLERALADRKYRISKRGRFVYARKGALGPWGDMITHVSILLVLLGALVGSLGMVGTVNVYEGDFTDQFYNWNTGKDQPFGFSLFVEKFTLEHYPADLSVTVRDTLDGHKVGTFQSRGGSAVDVTGTDIKLVPNRVDFERQEALFDVYSQGRLIGVYDTAEPDGGTQAPLNFKYAFTTGPFAEPVIKNLASSVRITGDGKELCREVITINSPLKFGGYTIYQTAYSRDPRGRYYSGFEIVKDPGLPLVWAGFALLLAGLILSFYFYHRQVWIFAGEDRIYIGGTSNKDMPGFMREYSSIIRRFMQEIEP
ncbi:MAG: cytochrome c biogenesis protein ResB [Nitrospirota bacterium]